MTVETNSVYSGPYTTDGVATAFPFNFRALSAAEVLVTLDGVTANSGLYRVTLAAQSGNVIFTSPPAAGQELYVESNPSFQQAISFSNQSSFLPESHNEANDRAAIRDQVLRDKVNRSFIIPRNSSAVDGMFPYVRPDGSTGFAAGPPAAITESVIAPLISQLLRSPVTLNGQVAISDVPGGHLEATNLTVGPYKVISGGMSYLNCFVIRPDGGSGGTVVACDFAGAVVGGNQQYSTVEAKSALLMLRDSRACPNGQNLIGITSRCVSNVDGSSSTGAPASMFGLNIVTIIGPQGTNHAIFGCELDWGGTYNGGNTCVTNIGMALVRHGDLASDPSQVNDAALYIASSAALAGNGHVSGICGSRAGVQFGDGFGPNGYGAPVRTDGAAVLFTAGNPWTAAYGWDSRQVPFSTAVIATQFNYLRERDFLMRAPNHSIGLGDPTQTNVPGINLYGMAGGQQSASISATGGTPGMAYSGQLNLLAALLVVNGTGLRPQNPNSFTIGRPDAPIAGGYTQVAFTITSDERKKTELEPFDDRMWAFIRALKVGTYRYLNQQCDEVKATRKAMRPKVEMKMRGEWEIVTAEDGSQSRQWIEKLRETPVMKSIPDIDPATNLQVIRRQPIGEKTITISIPRTEPTLDPDGTQAYGPDGKPLPPKPVMGPDNKQIIDTHEETRPIFGDAPGWSQVPDMEEYDEEYTVTPSILEEYRRTHWGVTAQQLRQALFDSGLDTDPDFTQSIHAVFNYDASVDLYGVRYSQLHAAEIFCIKSLDDRVTTIESKLAATS